MSGVQKSDPLSSPRERGPDLTPSPKSPKVGAVIRSMNCDIRWAASTNNSFHARMLLMPREGAIIFADRRNDMTCSLRLREYPSEIVRLSCSKCGRAGQYRKEKLIERYGADMRLPDLREEIARCERRGLMHDACMVRYVDLIP